MLTRSDSPIVCAVEASHSANSGDLLYLPWTVGQISASLTLPVVMLQRECLLVVFRDRAYEFVDKLLNGPLLGFLLHLLMKRPLVCSFCADQVQLQGSCTCR